MAAIIIKPSYFPLSQSCCRARTPKERRAARSAMVDLATGPDSPEAVAARFFCTDVLHVWLTWHEDGSYTMEPFPIKPQPKKAEVIPLPFGRRTVGAATNEPATPGSQSAQG
jgi:hypothetical protein